MSSKLYRTLLLALAVLVLAGVSSAFADPAPAPGPQAPPLVSNPVGCGAPALDLFAPSAEDAQCKAAVSLQVVAPLQPEFMVTFHGHCRCSCSRTPDCNTSADCGGAPCLGGITCC